MGTNKGNMPGGGIMHIDLEKLVKAMDGRALTFFCKRDGEQMDDSEARGTLSNYIAAGYRRIPMRKDDTIEVQPERDTSRLGRLRKLVAKLEQEIMDYRRKCGCIIVPVKMTARLAAAKEELAEAEAYAPKELGKILSREKIAKNGVSEKMVKVHIAADYLTETASVLRDALEACGVTGCNLFPIVESIERKAAEFTAIVCHPEFAGLSDFMTTNETLIRHLDTLCDRYLSEHLDITEDVP